MDTDFSKMREPLEQVSSGPVADAGFKRTMKERQSLCGVISSV
jgi:hypothetical protein